MTPGLRALGKAYMRRALHDSGAGMKALLLDRFTTGAVGTVLSQAEAMDQQVFLIESLEEHTGERHEGADDEDLKHLKALVFARCEKQRIEMIKKLLRAKRFSEVNIFFTGITSDMALRSIADADVNSAVRLVEELYLDHVPIDEHFFHLDIEDKVLSNAPPSWSAHGGSAGVVDRVVDGLASISLAIRRRPSVRFQESSEASRRVATDLARLMHEEEPGLFDFRRSEGAAILVVDRADDPVTPLLTQWTYQAMVNELIGLHNNRVRPFKEGKREEEKEEVLDQDHDEFFGRNRFSNYGELGANLKQMVDEFQRTKDSNKVSQVSTIEEMRNLVDKFPQLRKEQGNVSKHVSLMASISGQVEQRSLLRVSQVEQELACGSDKQWAYEETMKMVRDPSLSAFDKAKLAALFSLRYERDAHAQTERLMNELERAGVGKKNARVAREMRSAYGAAKRSGDLYGDRTLLKKATRLVGGIRGVDNVYTQHVPMLSDTAESMLKGKLREEEYPFAGRQERNVKERPQVLIVFVLGGVTYEESRAIHNLNSQLRKEASNSPQVLLGGTSAIDSACFWDNVSTLLDLHPR